MFFREIKHKDKRTRYISVATIAEDDMYVREEGGDEATSSQANNVVKGNEYQKFYQVPMGSEKPGKTSSSQTSSGGPMIQAEMALGALVLLADDLVLPAT
jgi:hypothetical protein